MKINRTFLVLIIWLAPLAGLHAEDNPKTPLLERVISIQANQETVANVLKKIGDQGGFSFSYSPNALDATRIISLQVSNKTVRELLDQLFKGAVRYRERKKYIILTKVEIATNEDRRKINGYVVDETTGERLKNVSIYDPISLTSAVTDQYGYFQLDIPKPSNAEVRLAVKKLNYIDTSVTVSPDRRGLLHVRIDKQKIVTVADSVGRKLKRFWLSTRQATIQAINMLNIDDTLNRHFQFSFVPFVGTNHKLSGNIINDYSINALGGYSLGVRKFEMGGLFNAVRGDVQGVQLAGLANGVLGETNGFQAAGLINANRGYVEGVQLAGLVNFNYDSAHTFAAAGLINFGLNNTRGVKLAGLGNAFIGKQTGPAFAGLFNFSLRNASTAQVAGIVNVAVEDMDGVQIASILNLTARSVTGVQIASIANVAVGNSSGAQLSGIINLATARYRGAQISLVNYAHRLKGFQFGALNLADSIDGIPIGLLSFVNKGGYHKLEVSADEVFYTNFALRSGVRQFYNILTVGARPKTLEDEKTIWTFGYGIGTAPRLSQKLLLNIDLTSNQIMDGNTFEKINLLNKLYVGVEYQLAPKLGIVAGVTLNGYVTDITYTEYPDLFVDYTPKIFTDRTYSNDMNLKMWLGGKIGVRFF